jgi:putative nucleotidyltransferase with HDIG domain
MSDPYLSPLKKFLSALSHPLFASLRIRLVLLVLLALLPVFGLAFYDRYEQRQQNARTVQSQALELARRAMIDQLELIGAAHQLLLPLTQLAVVRGEGPIPCNDFFPSLLRQNTAYTNLGVIDVQGAVTCAGVVPSTPVNVRTRPYFTRVLQQLVIFGESEIGVIVNAPTINFALPIIDGAQQTQGAVFASLDLAWFRWFAERENMPNSSTLVLVDRTAALGVLYPKMETLDTRALATSRVAQWFDALEAQRVIDFGDPDGVTRLYAFVPLGPTGYMGIGIPSAIAYDKVDRTATRDLGILLIVTGLAIAAAWGFGDWFLTRQVRALLGATQRIAGGDLSVRTGQWNDASELGQLAHAFDQMATTLQQRADQQKQSEEALLHQAEELAAITRLSREVTMVLDLNQVLESIARVTARLSQSDASGVYIPDAQGILRLAIGYGVSPTFVEALNAVGIKPGEGAIGRVEVEQHPAQLHDMNVGHEYSFTAPMRAEGLRAVLAVPMIRHDRTVGEIVLWHRQPRRFTVSEIAFLQAIAQQCVNAVENARLMQSERDARELAEALRDTAATLSSTLDFDELLDRILDNVGRVVPHDSANFMLIEQDHARVVRCRFHATVEGFPLNKPIAIEEIPSLRGMIETGQARAVEDTQNDAEWIEFPETRWIRSHLGAPICIKGQVIGFLNLDSATPGFFQPAHIPRLQAFADQAALALENARLLAETEKRAGHFAALHETAQTIAAQQDLPALLETIVQRAMLLLGASHCGLYLYDITRHDLELVVQEGLDVPRGIRMRLGEGMAGRVAQAQQPLIVNDYGRWEHRASQFADIPFSAVLQVPLLHRGELIGVLSIAEIGATTRQFTDEDARLLNLFASQVAGAVHNTRLLQQAQTRAEQLALLYDAGLALNSLLEPRAQVEYLLKIAMRALRADRAVFFRHDAAHNSLRLQLCAGYTAEDEASARRLTATVGDEQSIIGWVATNRLPLNLPEVSADPRYQMVSPELRAGLWMPVEHEGRLLGVFGALSARPAAFQAADERLLGLFANQAAVALENARLFEEAHQHVDQLAVLNRIASAVNQTFGLDELLEAIHREIAAILPCDVFYIALYDSATDELDYRIRVDAGLRLPPENYPLKMGLSWHVITQRQPVLIRDRATDTRFPISPETLWGTLKPAQSLLGVPIQISEAVVGIVSVQSYTPNTYDDADMRWLVTIADQVALAIHRARLSEETRQRLAELEAVNDISKALRVAHTSAEILPVLLDAILAVIQTDCGAAILLSADPASPDEIVARGWLANAVKESPHRREGITRHVLTTGETYISTEFHHDPLTPPAARSHNPPGWGGICLPIRTSAETIGVLLVAVQSPRMIQANEAQFLTTVAEMAGTAIQRAGLHEQTEQRLRQLDALHTIDTAINASLDLRVTLHVLLTQISLQLGVDAVNVLLLDVATQHLESAGGHGFRISAPTRVSIPLGEGYPQRAALERKIIHSANLSTATADPRAVWLANEGFVAYCAAPLISKGQLKGVVEVFHRAPLSFTAEWLAFFGTLAGQTALAIENITLFNSLRRSNVELALAYDSTIEGWSRALELRDHETEGHTQRVAEMTCQLARALGINDADLVNIRRGALLHDIGKMAIPDHILLKTSQLTKAEIETMRKHPQYAYELLSPIDYLRGALDIPYCHHEKWDGTGYPRGLAGEEIPLAARVFAIVDVWDALRSERAYRQAWDEDQIKAYLQSLSGIHFDPQIVRAFLRLLEE